ncbi:hypothetical protein [Bacillus cereus group sp. BfR-BA-01329]|uniref:hypothetical protein n=1 Tax=Bacillus cereus group sp. BfR-BA-01329 TaxID=2920305 RepID=UPI001F578FC0|nr:hypothetical protein [Bacillus cereus group sp. BfR-BA-01329]
MKSNENSPFEHKKSASFLLAYSWEGKSKEQIIEEMELNEIEQKYVEDAMKELAPKGKYTGMDMDAYIVMRLAMDEDDVGPLDDDDIIYLN